MLMSFAQEELMQAVKEWGDAWNTRDIRRIWAFEKMAAGFGYRSLDRRDHAAIGEVAYSHLLERFFKQLEEYCLTLGDLSAAVVHGQGLVWGFYTEEFKRFGFPPERLKIRFSMTFLKSCDGWNITTYHRDIQPFGPNGGYLPAPAAPGSDASSD